jgi:hypothetical protein
MVHLDYLDRAVLRYASFESALHYVGRRAGSLFIRIFSVTRSRKAR